MTTGLPGRWAEFGRRWQAWRQQHDRRRWASSWQGEAFQADRLRFPSPWDDQLLETRLSLRVGNHLAYLLRDGEDRDRRALVFAGLVSNGHELEAVYLLKEKEWLHAPVSVAPTSWYALGLERLAAQLEQAEAGADLMAPQRRQRLWLEGHPNFAHQLLNTLTCLDRVDAAALGPVLQEGPEAFGPLRELFPAVQWQEMAEAQTGAWFELPLSQRPERISRRLRRQLRCRAAMVLSREALELERRLLAWKASGGWVLAVSVKARGAVAEGLNELLAAWLAALARQGPLPLLLIDGFSLPSGASSSTLVAPYLCPMGEVISAEAEQIRQLEAVLIAAALKPELLVCAGRPLLEALHLLQYADVYFMHQGTVQHKIGWFQESIPGIVHSNSQRNCGGSHPWGGMGETAPLWFPAEGCEDLEDAPRGSYRFRPEWEQQAVEWLCEQGLIERPGGASGSGISEAMKLSSQFEIAAKSWLDQAGDQLNEGVQLLPLRFLSRLASQQAGLNPPVQITSLKDLDEGLHQMLEKFLGFRLVVTPSKHGFGSSQGKAPSGMVKLVARSVWLAFTADRGSGICLFRVSGDSVEFDPQSTALPLRLSDLWCGTATGRSWHQLPGITCLAIDRFVRGSMYHEVCDHLMRAYRQQVDWHEQNLDRWSEHRIAFASTAWGYSRYLINEIIHRPVAFLEPGMIYRLEKLNYFSNLAQVGSPCCIRDLQYMGHLKKVVLNKLVPNLNERLPSQGSSDPLIVYINRLDSPTRKIEGEPHLAAALEALGVRNVSMTSLTPNEQILLFQSADTIIAPHGAALTNLLFASTHCRVVELLTLPRPHYKLICESLNLSYRSVEIAQLQHLGVHTVARVLLRMASEH